MSDVSDKRPSRSTDMILADLMEQFPQSAIQERTGGGGARLKYLGNATVRRRVLNAVGEHDFVIVNGPLFFDVKQGNNTVKLMLVHGRMTIPSLGTHDDFGVQILTEKGGEDMWKGAVTDCYKRCAASFGVGLELYGEDFEANEKEFALANAKREKLNALLKQQKGVKTMGDANIVTMERFPSVSKFAMLSNAQVNEWLTELEKSEGVPF